MSAKKSLNIAFQSPGWPLSAFPNGIISYLDNLTSGFDENIQHHIFTDSLYSNHDTLKNFVVDISKIANPDSLLRLAYFKAVCKIKSPYFEGLKQNLLMHHRAKRTALAIKELALPIDLLEVEESFGGAHFYTKEIKVPVITRLHGPWFAVGKFEYSDSASDRNRITLEGRGLRVSHGVTSPSQKLLEMTRAFYNLELGNAKVIPNPVKPPLKKDFWSLPICDRRQILFVGRFDAVKGADLVLKAFRDLANKNLDLVLNFVGPDVGIVVRGKKLSFWEYVKEIIPEENIRLKIHFLGHVDQKKIAELRKNATVTVVSSRFESFGISLVEAMAAGCPVVATNAGAIPEIIEDGFNGVLAETGSSESIAEKVQSLLDNQGVLNVLSKNAAEDVKTKYYPNVIASKMTQYYSDLLM